MPEPAWLGLEIGLRTAAYCLTCRMTRAVEGQGRVSRRRQKVLVTDVEQIPIRIANPHPTVEAPNRWVHLTYTGALDGFLHLGIIISWGTKGEMMQTFLRTRIQQNGLAW
jgi:hypothetical protein